MEIYAKRRRLVRGRLGMAAGLGPGDESSSDAPDLAKIIQL
jgi:hypothetical protein